jgi:hypothetical protein
MRRLVQLSKLRFGSAVSRAARYGRGRRAVIPGWFLIAVFTGLWSPGTGVAAEREVDLELVLAVDISGSIDLEEAALQRQGFVHAFRHPDVIEVIQRGRRGRIAVTYVEWAGDRHQSILVGWTEIANADSAAAFAEAVARPAVRTEHWTSISGAIAFAARSFEANGFGGRRRVIDISGDGPNNKGDYVVRARDRALAEGIVINGLTIINDRPQMYGYPPFPDLDLYYQDCVIGGQGAFVVVADGFEDFARAILRKMVLEIAGGAPPNRLLRLAAGRPRPPCNAGEIQLRNWLPDLYDF